MRQYGALRYLLMFNMGNNDSSIVFVLYVSFKVNGCAYWVGPAMIIERWVLNQRIQSNGLTD
jgi:hypothetical protein